MTKAEALHDFWSSFGLTAYDEGTVPDDAQMPYITYNVVEDSIGNPVQLYASVWDRSVSWQMVTVTAQEVADALTMVLPVDGGYIYLTPGTPFSQRLNDEDPDVRRVYINVQAEYLTAK